MRRFWLSFVALALCALAGARDISPHDGILRGAARAATIVVQPPVDLRPGTHAYWRLIGGSGTTAVDSGPNGWTATLVASPTWAATSLAFNGSTQYATVPAAATLAGATAFTIAVWVYRSAGQINGIYIETTSTSTKSRVNLAVNATNYPTLGWRDSAADPAGTAVSIAGTTIIAATTWTFIVADWAMGSVGTGQAHLYVNNGLVGSYSGTITALGTSTTGGIAFAALKDSGAGPLTPFGGSLSRLRVVKNLVWTASQRAAAYAEGPP